MNYFAQNVKLLRNNRAHSQQVLSDKLNISRGNLAKYEGAIHEPSFEVLIKISKYFNISIDVLLTKQLETNDLLSLPNYISSPTIILPIQVDTFGNNVIEVVPHNAQAGYSGMYGDAGFVESLDHITLPFLKTSGKCRAFPISGDSMPPYGDGSYVVAEYIDDRSKVTQGARYIVLSRDEGIVFKRIFMNNDNEDILMLHSDNPTYDPYAIAWSEVSEIWEFKAAISMSESGTPNQISDMVKKMTELQKELTILSKRFS